MRLRAFRTGIAAYPDLFQSSETEEDCPLVQPKGDTDGACQIYDNMNAYKYPTIGHDFLTVIDPSISVLPNVPFEYQR